MMKILNDLLTGKDNKTHDIARWSWMVTTLTVMAGAAWDAVHAGTIQLKDFAESVGIIAGAHGATIMMKKDAEPNEEQK